MNLLSRKMKKNGGSENQERWENEEQGVFMDGKRWFLTDSLTLH